MKNKKVLIIILLALVLLLGGATVLYQQLGRTVVPEQLATQASAPSGEEGQESSNKAPNVTVYDLQGNEVQLYDFLGKPIVLNFWASWCGPCQMEMPAFQKKYEELGDKVNFLMINVPDGVQETVTTASSFISRRGYTFPVFYDTSRDASVTFGVYSYPTTFILDAEGNAIAHARSTLSEEALQQGIDMVLE